MVTLIAVYDSEGCQGRCDAHCYEASEPGCICICGGRNHGAGLDQAAGNTRQLAQSWLERAGADRAELAVLVTHEPLFELGGAR
jgi:hypothetical protein